MTNPQQRVTKLFSNIPTFDAFHTLVTFDIYCTTLLLIKQSQEATGMDKQIDINFKSLLLLAGRYEEKFKANYNHLYILLTNHTILL